MKKKLHLLVLIFMAQLATINAYGSEKNAERKWYPYLLGGASMALNIPYVVHLTKSPNPTDDLKNKFFYKGAISDSLLNHALNIVSAACLWP